MQFKKPPGKKRSMHLIPVMNLATFTREWAALHSIRSHRLLPLTPYILKAAPVVSVARLG